MNDNKELLKDIEKLRVGMALDNNFPPDELYITEDETHYHICRNFSFNKEEKRCVSIEKWLKGKVDGCRTCF